MVISEAEFSLDLLAEYIVLWKGNDMVDVWKTLKMENITRIERIVAIFEVYADAFPDHQIRIKILERPSGRYAGFTNTLVKEANGSETTTAGYGSTIEEALEDTLRYFFIDIQKNQAFSADDFERVEPGCFL